MRRGRRLVRDRGEFGPERIRTGDPVLRRRLRQTRKAPSRARRPLRLLHPLPGREKSNCIPATNPDTFLDSNRYSSSYN